MNRLALVDRQEYVALKNLARWVRQNTEKRTRPSAALVELLNRLASIQGEPKLYERKVV